MSYLFSGCSSLKELNLSNFNTKKVTDMAHIFFRCKSLKELNLTNFKTNKNTNMTEMFYGCLNELKKRIKRQNIHLKV